MSNNINFDFTNEDISLDEIELRKRWSNVIKEWEQTDNKMCVFRVKNLDERRLCATSVRRYCKMYKKDYTVYLGKNKPIVYVIRG
jgi:hypothetical protein